MNSPLPTEAPESRIDLWGALWRRSWLIVLFGLIGAGLGYLQYLKQPPTYSSTARVLLVREGPPDLPVHGVTGREVVEGLANQTLLIRSPKIVEMAVKTGKLTSLPSLSPDEQTCIDLVAGGLSVSSVHEQSTMLDLTYTGRDPKDCGIIVNAVANAFQTYLGDSRQTLSKETVELIRQARDTLMKQLEEKEGNYRRFRETSTLLASGNKEAINIHAARLAQVESTRSQLLVERSQTKAELQAIEEALQTGGSREALLLMLDKPAANDAPATTPLTGPVTGRGGLRTELVPLLLQEQMLLESHGPDHPRVRSVRKQIDFTRSLFQEPEAAAEASPASVKDDPAKDFLAVYLESLRQELQTSARKEAELDSMFSAEQEAARNLSGEEIQDETHRADIARTQALFDAVVKRLQEVTLIQDSGGYSLEIVSKAPYGWRTGPDFMRTMLIGTCGGLFAGFLLAYLLELGDKSFRSSQDITQELGLRVIGHVPNIAPAEDPGGIDGRLCTVLKPRSATAEAFRGIRNALFFCTHGERHKVIQVTSPDPSDGKSTLACNLAVVIAQSGKKVLLVDADFRRPRVHELFNASDAEGLSSVITGRAELGDAVQESDVSNLSLLVCGPKPDNPSELLTLPRFETLLDALREKFDYVIIDSPPMLAVSDPSAVAARADGVILAVRIRKNGRRSAQQAAQMLQHIGANIVGVVVNGVSATNGGYYYSSYNQGPYHDEMPFYGTLAYDYYDEDEHPAGRMARPAPRGAS
jgi:capsular exopolysaccharide synthesis family protein